MAESREGKYLEKYFCRWTGTWHKLLLYIGEHVHGIQPNVYDWNQVFNEYGQRQGGKYEHLNILTFEHFNIWIFQDLKIKYLCWVFEHFILIVMFVIRIRLEMKKKQTEWMMEVKNTFFWWLAQNDDVFFGDWHNDDVFLFSSF